MTFAGQEQCRTTVGHVTRHDPQCVAPTRYSCVRSEGVALFLALLLLCTHSWGACVTMGYALTNQSNGCTRSTPLSGCNVEQCDNLVGRACQNVSGGAYKYGYFTQVEDGFCQYGSTYCNMQSIVCQTEAERDSVNCVLNPTAEGCVEEDVPSSCEQDYYDCMRLKGQWKKISSTATSCASECNTCGSAEVAFRNNQINVCCQKGLAPPDSAVQCYMPVNSGSGMTWSVRADKHNEEAYSCGELSTADGEAIQENQERFYRFCEQGERYEEQPDTNVAPGGGSSSSGGGESSESGSHSWANEIEALGGLYGVLDTIRDTLVKRLTPATETIRDCLLNWQTCIGMTPGGDTVIVNVNRDSSILKVDTTLRKLLAPLIDSSLKIDSAQFKTLRQLDSLYKRGLVNDTDIVQAVNAMKGDIDGVDSAVKGVEDGIDSLIDSMTLYMGRMPSSIVSSADSAIGEGYGGVDTSGVEFGWLGDGDSLADSIVGGSGYGGLNFAADSLLRDSLEGLGYVCTDSNCCVGSECIEFDSEASIQDSLLRQIGRYSDSVHAQNESFYKDSVKDMFQEVKDSLMRFNPLGIFDSTLMSTLGASVPNSNTCPDHCSTFAVDVPFLFGTQHIVIDWGLCMGRTALANGNVLSFLRFIIRIIVAVTCITAVMWNAARVRR